MVRGVSWGPQLGPYDTEGRQSLGQLHVWSVLFLQSVRRAWMEYGKSFRMEKLQKKENYCNQAFPIRVNHGLPIKDTP